MSGQLHAVEKETAHTGSVETGFDFVVAIAGLGTDVEAWLVVVVCAVSWIRHDTTLVV
jgi:hypothetical protein